MSCADSKQCNDTLLPLTKLLFEKEGLERKWSNLMGFGVTTVFVTGNFIKELFCKVLSLSKLN